MYHFEIIANLYIYIYIFFFFFSFENQNTNINTKNKIQNNIINYFLLDQWHINDIMALTYGTQQLKFEIESLKVTFTCVWQKTHKTERKYEKVLEKLK